MDKPTYKALQRIVEICQYIFEDDPRDPVLKDIAKVRSWMQEIEKEVE